MRAWRTWLRGRLPEAREPRWRAQMLLGFLAVQIAMSALFVPLVFLTGAEPLSQVLSVAMPAAYVCLALLALKWRRWQAAAALAVAMTTLVCVQVQFFDPGPQASVVAVTLIIVMFSGVLLERHGVLLVAPFLSGAILLDGLRPHDNGLPPGNLETDLVLSVLAPSIVGGMIWVISGIQRSSLRELDQAREAAEAGERAKAAFLATMSHEIRTPLNGVLGLTRLLQHTPLTAEQAELLSTLRGSGESLQHILNDVLDYSRLEVGAVALETRGFDPRQLCEDVVRLFSAHAQEKGLSLLLAVPGSLPPAVTGDAFRLRQVLMNLVGNALKFTERGEVILRVERDGDAALRFAVSDSGIGIPAERLGALFEPFTQAESSTTRRFGGTGLGLTICCRLVEAMGGTLSVHSVVGEGTTFTMSLPLPPAASAPAASRAAAAPARRSLRGRVLVAEDNAVNQLVIGRLLRAWGLEVDIVEDGLAALQAAEASAYDLVLMDQFMPELDGLEATRRLRAGDGWARQAPIFALTASVSPADQAACRAAGMDAIFAKPINEDRLFQALARHLPCVEGRTGSAG